MKLAMALIPALFAATAALAADDTTRIGSISCSGSRNGTTMELEAKTLIVFAKSARLKDAIATFSTDSARTVGRIDSIETDAKYQGNKYKDFYRFNLYELTDVETFGRFLPDGCDIKIMIPITAGTSKSFEAPVQYSCEQSGGVLTMSCDFASRD